VHTAARFCRAAARNRNSIERAQIVAGQSRICRRRIAIYAHF